MNEDLIKEIAGTILAQLGGFEFLIMVQPIKLVASQGEGNGLLSIVLDSTKTKENGTHYFIELNALDTYDIRYYRISSKGEKTLIASHDDVYCDMLPGLFRGDTGLSPLFPRIEPSKNRSIH